MLGPHYEKIAEVENKFNTRQLLQKIQSKSTNNPLTQVLDKLKKQFTAYQTAYDEGLLDHQIHSVDRLLSYDGKLGPVLAGLEKENNLLRKQLTVLQTQLSNTLNICEQIISENNQLKQMLVNKNHDIQKIIETISFNESEERSNLEDKIGLLQQENSILIRHLEEIKKQHENYGEKFQMERATTMRWKQKFQETKRHLNEVLATEKDLSRKLSLLEHGSYNEKQKIYELQSQNQQLKFQNNELKNEVLLLRNDQQTNNLETFKQKIEEQYKAIVEEHRMLKKERAALIREIQEVKLKNQDTETDICKLQNKLSQVSNNLEMTTNLFNEQKHKNASLQSHITRLEAQIDQLREENNKLKLECESTNHYAINKQKNLHRQIQELRTELDNKSIEMQSRLREIKEKTKSLMEAKEGQLKSLNDTNIELRKLLERKTFSSS